MRLPSSPSPSRRRELSGGFTLVEMLVVAPVVLLVIAGIVGAMTAMIGDALVANARASTAYDIQDTLTRIEQDARISVNFMDTFSSPRTPQGRNNDTTPFAITNGDVILSQQATTKSPYDDVRDLVYYKNQPIDCAGDTSGNRALLTKVIYFVRTDATGGTSTLWRRSIVDDWNTTTSDSNSVCAAPWQRNSCAADAAANTLCKASDEKMLGNITAFTATYYDKYGNTSTSPALAVTVKITLTTSRKIAGKSITQSSSIEATRINDIPVVKAANSHTPVS